MGNNWVTNENDNTITHKHSGHIFRWAITAESGAVLAPCFDTATEEGYLSLLKEAERAGAESVHTSENIEAFKHTLNYRKQYLEAQTGLSRTKL